MTLPPGADYSLTESAFSPFQAEPTNNSGSDSYGASLFEVAHLREERARRSCATVYDTHGGLSRFSSLCILGPFPDLSETLAAKTIHEFVR